MATKKYRIMVADAIAEKGLEILREAAEVDVLANVTAAELLAVIGTYDALIVRGRTRVTAEVVKAGVRLTVIGRAGVGVDNIDLTACQERSITVVNSPLAASVAVAEHTLGLMLSLARQVPYADAAMKRGQWPKKQVLGVELSDKCLGLIAVGRIGASVSGRAVAFGMRVIAHDPFLTDEDIRARKAEPAQLHDVLRLADFVSIHTPLTAETYHLINAAAIAAMKPGVHIICAARGGVVDEAALLAALESGHVAGAALDVFENEPPGDSSLVKHPRVIATPHVGAQTREAQIRAGVDIAEEVLSALSGRALRWSVRSA